MFGNWEVHQPLPTQALAGLSHTDIGHLGPIQPCRLKILRHCHTTQLKYSFLQYIHWRHVKHLFFGGGGRWRPLHINPWRTHTDFTRLVWICMESKCKVSSRVPEKLLL